jgi:hypothetical protein
MAAIKTQPVLGDLGSHEVQLLLTSYNNLLTALGDLITGLKTAANIGAVNILATTAETSLQANVYKVQTKPQIPPYKHMPTRA